MKKRLLAVAVFLPLFLIAVSGSAHAVERWVDDDYTSGGANDGHTWGVDAFDTIGSAVAASSSGDVVTVNEGVYTGTGNKDITVNIRLTIRSAGGAATTVIDPENSGRAFVFQSGATDSTLEGLTIQNGRITASFLNLGGGAVQSYLADLTVLDCVFDNNGITETVNARGGAISVLSASMTVRGCRFSNNYASNSGGALALMLGGQLAIESTIFEDNVAGYTGGGIFADETVTAVNSCLFSGNSAEYEGGGIRLSRQTGTVQVVNCTFADNDSGRDGGGLAAGSGGYTVSASNSIFWGNAAFRDGAQLYADNGPSLAVDYAIVQGGPGDVVVLFGSSLDYGENNLESDPLFVSASDFHLQETSAGRDSGTGSPPGGLSAYDAEGGFRVQNGTVDRGALEVPGVPSIGLSSANFSFDGDEMGRNPADQVLSITNPGEGTLNWTVSESCAWLAVVPESGDTFIETDDVALRVNLDGLEDGLFSCDLTVSDPTADNDPQTVTVNLTVEPSIFVPDDHATIQAAIDAATVGQAVVVRDGVWSGSGNVNLDFGGKDIILKSENGPEATVIDCGGTARGIILQNGETAASVVEGITIRNANAVGNGGGILCEGSSPRIVGCVFENNVVSTDGSSYPYKGLGGALYAGASANPTIENCRFTGNTALGSGAAVAFLDSRGQISGCGFDRNRSVYHGPGAGYGGAVYVRSSESLSITDCFFTNNEATLGGGAVSFMYSSTAVSRSTFSFNRAFNGGALYREGGSVDSNLSSSFFIHNSTRGNGGSIYSVARVEVGALNITNCTLLNNSAEGEGGAVSNNQDSILHVANSILWGNSAGGNPNQIHNSAYDASNPLEFEAHVTIGHCDIQGGLSGVVNYGNAETATSGTVINQDPLFLLPEDPHLTSGSPCIGTGFNSPAAGLPGTDLDGNPRVLPDGGRVDMGACEFDPSPAEAAIAVSPHLFDLSLQTASTGPLDLPLTLANRGAGALNWEIASDCLWVSADPAEGVLDGDVANVLLSVDTSSLSVGKQICLLTVSDSDGAAPTQTVTLTATVAKTIFVSANFDPLIDDYETIQEGIDAAVDGDTVIVRGGTYTGNGNKNLNFEGKAITVRSEYGPEYTIIDCENDGRAIRFHWGETEDAVFKGFKVTGGHTEAPGGAMLCEFSSPMVSNCIFSNNESDADGGALSIYHSLQPMIITGTKFTDNVADGDGGAIATEYSQVTIRGGTFSGNASASQGGAISEESSTTSIENSLFRDNSAVSRGGAYSGIVSYSNGAVSITNCVFDENEVQGETGEGGAVYLLTEDSDDPSIYTAQITNCTFSGNSTGASGKGGAVSVFQSSWLEASRATLTNCVLWGNAAGSGSDVYVDNVGEVAAVDMINCDIPASGYENGELTPQQSNAICTNENNIDANPEFRDADDNDFRLKAWSPCLDAGKTVEGLFSDHRGSIRPVDGNDDGVASFDIGAFEYSRYFGGGGEDAPAKPFQDLAIDGRRVIIGYEYKISWKDKPPFPAGDPRVSEAGEYEVTIALVDEENERRVDLITTTQALVTTQDTGYSVRFTFGFEHIGTWRLSLAFASDPHQYVLSDEPVTIEYQDVTTIVAGQPVPAPSGAWPEMQPDAEDDSLCFWSPISNRLIALKPGLTTVTWYADEGKEQPIPVIVRIIWPSAPQIHIAGSPAVELVPEGSPYNTAALKYSATDETLVGTRFDMTGEGYSVLHFYNSTTETEKFEVVRTLFWHHADDPDDATDPAFPVEDTWNIGQPLTPAGFHDPECGGGYVFNAAAPYDGNGDDRACDRDTRTGPVIPVNEDRDGTDNDLVVVWYRKDVNGICWPGYPVRYTPKWPDAPVDPENPADADRPVKTPEEMPTIVIETGEGSGPLDEAAYGSRDFIQVYCQPDTDLPGYNPNEEHALIQTSGSQYPVLYALRNDLNRGTTSKPYALLKYRDPDSGDWAIEVYKVLANQDTGEPGYVPFLADAVTGMRIHPPYPLSGFTASPCAGTGPLPGSGPTHEDKNGELYALNPVEDEPVVIHYSYPLQEGFDYDIDGDGEPDAQTGECVSWELTFEGEDTPEEVNVTYDVRWPDTSPVLQVSETLMTAKNGLPDITSQCSVKLLYGQDRARLIDPMVARAVSLPALPGEVDFDDLPFHVSERVAHDEDTGRLTFEGYFDDTTAGDPLLLPNIMSAADRDLLLDLSDDNDYQDAVHALYSATRGQLAGQSELATGTAASKALTAGAAADTGHVVLGFNDNEACTAPVDLNVLRVECPPYTGEIKVIEPENVFDNRVTLRHSGDFGGDPDIPLFQWKWWEDDDDRPGDVDAWHDWFVEPPHERQGAVEIVVEGEGEITLADKWFAVRYQVADGPCGPVWSDWTEPQLYQGWIKRILAAVNLFDQRFSDFHANEVNTAAGMIQEAGQRYEGDAALNYDPDNLDALGLIEFYQTVLNRARELTVDAVPPQYTAASNQQLLLMASRLSDLYMLLGNEAYADTMDPTIGFSTEDEIGSAATAIFSFQNQVPSLLEEELALLRGKATEGLRPHYNRLVWNFTQAEGEVAYSQNYSIFDWNGDGFLDEYDAREYFPQGHGDAWGHYLTAMKFYYDLLRHPEYNWVPRAESLLVAGAPVPVDYEDERRFARAAAAKAKTGAAVVDLVLRERYDEDSEAALTGYKDADTDRAWGVNEWAERAGQGAYFDWVVGNAIIPAKDDEHEGIEKVDRTTVAGLREIPSQFAGIQAAMDKADMGLNPLGLAKGAVPFDFNPSFDAVGSGIQGDTHFEQVYRRAMEAVNNAVTVFNHANQNTQRLRSQLDSVGDFQVAVEAEERDYRNRLIEIYGYPYTDDCGPGKLYPLDYCESGPDLYHFMYVDESELTGIEPTEDPFPVEIDIAQLGVTRYEFYRDISGWDDVNRWELFTFPPSDDTLGIVTRPDSWTGVRKAPGEAQMALSDLVVARAEYLQAVEEHGALIDEIEDSAKLLAIRWNVNSEQLEILNEERGSIVSLNTGIMVLRGFNNAASIAGEFVYDLSDAFAEAIPDGWSDIGAPAAGAFKIVGSTLKAVLNIFAGIFDLAELGLEHEKERISLVANIDSTRLENDFELQQMVLEIENLIREEIPLRIQIYTLAEAMNQARAQYLSVLAEGERILEERHTFRTLTAADIQEYRYKDMSFRIFRNDALQKYHAQFEMAALYTYLAAKAYDYETALLDADTAAGRAFFADILRCRSIGQVEDGEPVTGTGLADVLKRLNVNFQVFKPQMGLDNPQFENNRFSLRSGLFRLLPGSGSDEKWRRTLETHRVDDLWQVPEFKRYCRPFADEGLPQPGIVIPFDTTVTAGLNYFGWPLGAADSYYSTANFATKVWSAGVWFSDYNSASLALTPRVYLVPAGVDSMRSPSGDYGSLRNWEVVDQRIPLPFTLTGGELEDNPAWIPTCDTLADELFAIRRHGDFRAYHDAGYWDDSEMTANTRIVGRSVWNTRWLLIIPGQNLLADPEEGIERFVNGLEIVGSDGDRTGEGISDIKLFFRTYSFMGN